MKKKFEYRHTIGFEDTNLTGNVYFANYIRWQGKCREIFIKEKAPGLLLLIEKNELAIITTNCSCEFLSELHAFDEVIITMELLEMGHNRVKMRFEYYIEINGARKTVAIGYHEIGCFSRMGSELGIIPVPPPLKKALQEYNS